MVLYLTSLLLLKIDSWFQEPIDDNQQERRISTYVAADNDLTKKNINLKFPEMIPIWQNVVKLYLCKVHLSELPDEFGSLQVHCFKKVRIFIIYFRIFKSYLLKTTGSKKFHMLWQNFGMSNHFTWMKTELQG